MSKAHSGGSGVGGKVDTPLGVFRVNPKGLLRLELEIKRSSGLVIVGVQKFHLQKQAL